MTVYILVAVTYVTSWKIDIEVLGVYTKKENANAAYVDYTQQHRNVECAIYERNVKDFCDNSCKIVIEM